MRVAIVRLTSLGDVVHTLPVAHALRSRGKATVVWIVEEHEQEVLRDNPAVDEIVVGPTRRWRQQLLTPPGIARVWREMRQLHEHLRSLRLDAALDIQGLLKSSLFLGLSDAPVRVGFTFWEARDPLSSLFTNHRIKPPHTAQHVVDKNLALLEPLGIPAGEVQFPLPTDPAAEHSVDALLRENGIEAGDRLLVVLPSTRGPRKQWPPERFVALAKTLRQQERVKLVLVGSPSEESLLRGMAQGVGDGQTLLFTSPIRELIALLRRSHLTIGNDTGPLHISAALGRPTVGLYGPTRSERNGPYGPNGRSLQSPTARMRDISVDAVIEACRGLL